MAYLQASSVDGSDCHDLLLDRNSVTSHCRISYPYVTFQGLGILEGHDRYANTFPDTSCLLLAGDAFQGRVERQE
jgi:hypothetical protein